MFHFFVKNDHALARKGELPGTRIGKSWVFLREDVMAFLKEQITRALKPA